MDGIYTYSSLTSFDSESDLSLVGTSGSIKLSDKVCARSSLGMASLLVRLGEIKFGVASSDSCLSRV